jgi:hypothetical protein
MRKCGSFILSLAILSLLAVPAASQSYDNSPARRIIIPECIWAPATGGGTWVSEVQITAKLAGTQVAATFYYGTGFRYVILYTTSVAHQTVKYSNILSSMQLLDSGFTYYGRVGTLWLYSQSASYPIWAQAMTVNGNYGKTFPGLPWEDSNTANLSRNMVIPNIIQTSQYRTFVGFFNAISGGYPMTVRFYVMSYTGFSYIGSYFEKTFAPWEFMSFNPFTEAGLTGTVLNSWLYIMPLTSGSSGVDTKGLFCFGSIANNYTNDTYALIAIPFQ